jgi:Ca-activated chloride channel family protein
MLETLRRSQEAAVRFLTTLPNAQEIIVVFFDQAQRVEHFDRDHPEALFEQVKTIPDGGNTALRDAIVFSLRTLGTSHGRSALVLLTDGIDTVSATDPLALEKAVQSTAVTIYPVAYPASPSGDGEDPAAALKDLSRLARISGGRLFKLPNEQALPGVLDEIAADLRAQYVLGFAPDTAGSPGRFRKISVKVPGHGKVVVRHRVGYRLQQH